MNVRKPTGGEWLAILWPATALVLVALIPAIGDWNVFFVPFILLGWLLAGLVVIAALLISQKWRAAGLFAILTFLMFFLSPIASSLGARGWNLIQFKRSASVYADIVVRASTLPDQGRVGDVAYRIERGSPDRIAFPLPVGITDNWAAVVHDPSDAVATAQGWGERLGDYTVRADLKALWGGDMLACSRISGHYYRCDFT